MKPTFVLLHLLLLPFLSGCATKWAPPAGMTEQQAYQVRYQCEREVAQLYPEPPPIAPAAPASTQTNCTAYGNQINCQTTPASDGGEIVRSSQQAADRMSLARKREEMLSACLRAKGFRPEAPK